MGGVFNHINGNLYHYAGNNPVRYVDPDGNAIHILVGAGIGASVGVVAALCGGKSGREIVASAVGGAVFGGMVAATGGPSLGAQLVGGAMAGITAYLAESAVAGNEATLAGCATSAVAGTTAVVSGKVLEQATGVVASKIKPAKTYFRNMSNAELEAVKMTGMLRGGNPGRTYFTNQKYNSASEAKSKLSLPARPTHQVEFQTLNNPEYINNGSIVKPGYGELGGGIEFSTNDTVEVKIINVTEY